MRWALILSILLIVVSIGGLAVFNYYSFSPNQPGVTRPQTRGPFRGPDGFRGPGGRVQPQNFESNGEQIFLTGTSSRGTIGTTGGPFWFQMHGGGCAACHGSDGRGGVVVMMGRLEAPNITYEALTSEVADGDDHRPYTDELIQRAITEGLEPDGERLSDNMPRWQMSSRDLDDLIAYLKTLDQ